MLVSGRVMACPRKSMVGSDEIPFWNLTLFSGANCWWVFFWSWDLFWWGDGVFKHNFFGKGSWFKHVLFSWRNNGKMSIWQRFFKMVVSPSPTAIFETIEAESAEQARDCDDIYLHVHYVYLEPNWPLFLKVNLPKERPFQPKQGDHLGSRYIYVRVSYNVYLDIYMGRL